MSLYSDLKQASSQYLKKKAIFYKNKFYSYNFILNQVDSLCEYLKNEMHLHSTVIVTICLKNSLFALLLIYACNKLGIIVNLINPNLAADQIIYFDLMLKSRLLFLDKPAYLDNAKIFKNIKTKITLIDYSSFNISKQISYYKNRKKLDIGIPFSYKIKKRKVIEDISNFDKDNNIAFTAPNEKFDEVPNLACASNGGLHQAMINQSEIYHYLDQNNIILPEASMMSLPLFMTYYHTPLMNGICVCLDDTNDDKTFNKILKSHKISLFGGDISSFNRLFKRNEKIINNFVQNLNRVFIYNDAQRTYIYDLWISKCHIALKDIKIVSLLGGVETLGAFVANEIDDININNYGTFLGDYEPHIKLAKRKDKFGILQIMSKAMMVGYYKNADKNQEIIDDEFGILTDFEGNLDINNHFYLSNCRYINMPYIHNSPYLVNIKDLLTTIPGISDVDVTISFNVEGNMELTVTTEKKQSNQLNEEMDDYLSKQLKNKNISYKIKVKD